MLMKTKATSETAIEPVLLASGFERHQSPDFNREQALFPTTALRFIQTTQKPVWD
jgi:hypothetical protein